MIAYYSKRLPEAVANYSISELELTGVMANVVAFKHLLRNANFHVYCDHSALVHILKAKREPPTLRLKKLIENLSEYKFDIYFLKGKEMHISDFLSRHPDDEGSPNEIIPIAFMLQQLGNSKFPDHLLYLKEKVDELLEQDNYIPYQEDDFMFIFSNDKHENMSLLSDLYGAETSRIDSLCVCKQEKEQLHDILNIMTRSMSKAKQADVPAIYPLKGVHSKPEHVKPEIGEVKNKTGEKSLPKQTEPMEMPVIDEHTEIPEVHEHSPEQGEANIYQIPMLEEQVRRPNPLLEPSSFSTGHEKAIT